MRLLIKRGGGVTKAPPPPKRTAGKKANLSRSKIAEAAIVLIEQSPGFSIRRLADMMGVFPATIHCHFPGGMAALRTEMVRVALADLAPPLKSNESGADYLRGLFARVRHQLHKHPTLAQLVGAELAKNPFLNPRLSERILAALRTAGLGAAELPRSHERVMTVLIGFVAMEFPCLPQPAAHWTKDLAAELKLLSNSEYPVLAELGPEVLAPAGERAARLASGEPGFKHAHAVADDVMRQLGLNP